MATINNNGSSSVHEKQAQFALDLLRSAAKPHEDVIMSPVSITVALAMTYLGAAGETKTQMNNTLFPGLSDEEVHGFFSELVNSLNQTKNGYQLHTANRLYAQRDYPLLAAFIEQLAKHYRSELMAVDFRTQADAVAGQINDWVAGVTMDKIRNLLGQGALAKDTRFLLVNAIYFKGEWVRPFEARDTTERTFYATDGSEKKVQMMVKWAATFDYGEHADCQVLGMPYKDQGDLLMYFILPKERQGLPALEKALTGERLLKLISETSSTYLKVMLPKFKLEKAMELKEVLSSWGMKDMFIPLVADFTNITGGNYESGVIAEPLYVSSIYHKAIIEVDEQGSEAAAVTVGRMKGGSDAPRTSFIADHPFLFAIADGKRLFFVGRVGGGGGGSVASVIDDDQPSFFFRLLARIRAFFFRTDDDIIIHRHYQ